MKSLRIVFFALLGIIFFANPAIADIGELPLDIGEVQIVLTPTTAGEEDYTYRLQCTYMGNNHYSLCGKATHFFGFILDGKDAPPGYVHTKVVHGNAEVVGDEIVIYLQEVYAEDEVLLAEGQKELNSASVRIVINPVVLVDKGDATTWTGTYTAIQSRYYFPGVILDKSDRGASFFSQKFIEGTSAFTIPAP